MTISKKDVFLSILSMDAYNRGYGQGINGLGGIGTQIGNVTIKKQSDIDAQDPGVINNFYGVSYKVEDSSLNGLTAGQTIVSYRGITGLGQVWNPLSIATGEAGRIQAQLGITVT